MALITLAPVKAGSAGSTTNPLPQVSAQYGEVNGVAGFILFVPLAEDSQLVNKTRKVKGEDKVTRVILGMSHNGKNKFSPVDVLDENGEIIGFNGSGIQATVNVFVSSEDEEESGEAGEASA